MSIFVPNNSGTVTFTNGSTTIAGVGTLFTGYRAGSVISIPGIGEMQLAADPTNDTEAEGIVAWQGATTADKAFQYLPRNEEGVFTDKLTQLLSDLGNGNMQALAGLTLSASKVLVGMGPGALGLADRSEFVNGVRFNARVPDEAGLAAYASKPGPNEDEPGFTVLIETYGAPPRTVLVSKASDASGDWTDPAYVEGNIGEKGWTPLTIRVEDGERQVIQLSGYIGGAGDAPTDNVGQYLKADGTWTATIGDALDVRGASFNWIAGGYNGANAYAKRDALRDQGAAWIALQAVPPGNPPPTLPTTSNAHWDLMSEPGQDGDDGMDGTGIVNSVVAGTGISVDNTDPENPIIINTGDVGGSGGINDAYLSLLQADTGLVGFIGGIADAFADQTGVDEGLTTGESWSAGQYAPATSGGTSYANAGGTGDRTGSISVTTTFSAVTGTPDNLVDGALTNSGTDSFVFTLGQTSGYFQFDFGSAKLFDEFKWEQQNATAHGTWKWQGSNSPSSGYVDVGASFTLGGATTATVAVAGSTTPYRYWRLVIVSGSTSDAAWCREITFKIGTTAPTVSSMTVVSQAFGIDAQVDTANLLVRLLGDEAFDINSDVTAEVSRDGASWVLADLVVALTSGDDEYFVAGIDLSEEPPGTDMRWRIKTYGKSVRLTGASLQWGAPGLTLPLTSGTFSGPFPSDFPVDKLVAAYFFDESEAEAVRDVMGGAAIDLTGPTNPNATVTAKGILLQSGLVQTPLLTGVRCQTLLYRVAKDETGSKLLISGGAGSTSGAKPDTLTVGETHLYGGSGFDMHTPYFNSATGASAWELNRGGWGVYHRQDTAARDSVFGFGGEHSSTNFRVSEMEIGQAFFWSDVLTTDEVSAVFRFVRQRASKLGIYLHRDDCPYREDVFVLLGDSTADGRAPWADLSSGDQGLDYRHTLIAAGDTSNVAAFDKFELGYNQQIADLNDVGPEIGIAYARRLVGKSVGRCRVLKFGVGGSYAAPSSTGVPAAGNSWSPDEAVGSGLIWYALRQWQQSFQDMLREGIGWDSVKVACLLGLNDSTNDLSAPSSAAYQGYLQDILDTVEAQFSGAAVDFMLFRAHDSAPGSGVTALAAVRSGSDAFGAANSNVTVEDTDAIDLEADNVHYSAAGSKVIGALRHG